ncbi:Rho-binding antiterminator [Shewanella corallii]|uniref:Rho-binding antiterminator n=1 Tax=Shewanella corallii TaxID=560080 RepID=A0ABT0NCQ3_9GAMM|nr:Rho-binding antiterminator [Shewanella corallii]MCL2915562.1 Rho-binding antiterminator [Shewanella corallii]
MINCEVHDVLELACIYRIEVQLTLSDGTSISGIASTTRTGQNKHEYLVIEHTDGPVEVDMESIKMMRALTRNPHFTEVDVY